MKSIVALILIGFIPIDLQAEEYFGEFSAPLAGVWNTNQIAPHSNPKKECKSAAWQDWNTFTLTNDFSFEDPNGLNWTTPNNHTVNGASVPKWAWWVIGSPYTGPYFPASVIHDYYVCKRSRTAHDTHRNFYYGMRANGVSWSKAQTMYWAVSVYTNWTLFDPKQDIQAIQIDMSNGRTARIFSNELQDIARNFEQEELQILRGEVSEGSLGLDRVLNDALNFRDVISGEISAQEYNGLAGEIDDVGVILWTPELPNFDDFKRKNLYESDWDVGIDYEFRLGDQDIVIENRAGDLRVLGSGGAVLKSDYGTIFNGDFGPIEGVSGGISLDERSMPWFTLPLSQN